VSNLASKGMGIGDCDCDLRWSIGRLLCLAFVGVCLQAERFTEPFAHLLLHSSKSIVDRVYPGCMFS
jgi:hypothetical protein